MIPLRLEIAGLQSFRERATIDFADLLTDGLFGIFGPTGSGKSTILDAMILALYGSVRRAGNSLNGIINIREKKCFVSFTFDVERDGERCRYRAERSFGKSEEGSVTTKRLRLVQIDGDDESVIAEKKKEMEEMVGEILGIDCAGFCRAVVLPQGEFAEFLLLEPAMRAKMLQQLFHLHDMGERLQKGVRQRKSQIDTAHAETKGQLLELAKFDDDTLAAITLQQRHAERSEEDSRIALVNANQMLKDAVELNVLIQEQRELSDAAAHHAEQRIQLNELAATLERAERAASLPSSIQMAEADSAALLRARNSMDQAVARHTDTSRTLAAADSTWNDIRSIHERDEPLMDNDLGKLERLRERSARLVIDRADRNELSAVLGSAAELYHNAQKQHSRSLDKRQSAETRIDALNREIQDVAVDGDDRRKLDEVGKLLGKIETARATLRDTEERLDQERAELDRHNVEERKEQSDLTKIESELKDLLAGESAAISKQTAASNACNEFTSQRLLLDPLLGEELGKQNDVERDLREIESLDKRFISVHQQMAEAECADNIAQNELQQLQRLRDDRLNERVLLTLRSSLQNGDACPVCGSYEHPGIPADNISGPQHVDDSNESAAHANIASESDIQNIDERIASQRTQAIETLRRTTELRSQSDEITRQRDERSLEAKSRASELAECRKKLLAICTAILPDCAEEHLLPSHESITALSDERDGALRNELNSCEQAINKIARERELLERNKSVSNDRADRIANTVSEYRVRVTAAAGRLAECAKEHRSLSAEIATIVGSEEDALLWSEKQLARRTCEDKLRDERAELERNLAAMPGRIDTQVDTLRRDHERLAQDLDLCDSRIAREQQECDACFNELVSRDKRELDLDTIIATLKSQRDDLRQRSDASRIERQTAYAEQTSAEREIKRARAEYDEESTRHDEQAKELAHNLMVAGFADVAEASNAMLTIEERDTLRSEHREAQARISRESLRLSELLVIIDGRTLGEKDLEMRQGEQSEHQEACRAATLALGEAQNALQGCIEKNGEWKSLSIREEQEQRDVSAIETLARYVRGNAFVEYLANERLAAICRKASLHLQLLSGNHFEIATRPADGFIIRDNLNGGSERSPRSLSGGETFIVSLALALALSDSLQENNRTRIEFFFLDEGFGALDNALLQSVLDSLERIRSPRRAIGLISHVASLRERITHCVLVNPANAKHGSTVQL